MNSKNYDKHLANKLISDYNKNKISWKLLVSGMKVHVRGKNGMYTVSHRIPNTEYVVLKTKTYSFKVLRGNISKLAGGLWNFIHRKRIQCYSN